MPTSLAHILTVLQVQIFAVIWRCCKLAAPQPPVLSDRAFHATPVNVMVCSKNIQYLHIHLFALCTLSVWGVHTLIPEAIPGHGPAVLLLWGLSC